MAIEPNRIRYRTRRRFDRLIGMGYWVNLSAIMIVLFCFGNANLSAKPANFETIGFGKDGPASMGAQQPTRHPNYTYAWYRRPYAEAHLGTTVEYTGIVLEQNGVIGLSTAQRGFQPIIQSNPPEMGSVIRVKGELVSLLVRPYWQDFAIAPTETSVLFTSKDATRHLAIAKSNWIKTIRESKRDLRCYAKTRSYKITSAPTNVEFYTNWDSEKNSFVFSFQQSDGMARSFLARDFFLTYDPTSKNLTDVYGVCWFFEDFC